MNHQPQATPNRFAIDSQTEVNRLLPVSKSASTKASRATSQEAVCASRGQRSSMPSSTAFAGQNADRKPEGRLSMPARHARNRHSPRPRTLASGASAGKELLRAGVAKEGRGIYWTRYRGLGQYSGGARQGLSTLVNDG